jgi:RimJ/RimL family protein N-acetyltransferase
VTVHVRAAPPAHYEWIAWKANLVPDGSFRAIEAVDDNGCLLAMVGYDGWMDNACQIHVALERPSALRHVLRPGFRVPFVELGKGVLVAKVLSTNERSLALVKHLGFREVCRGKDWVRVGIDLVVHEMRREECRFLEA